MVPHSTYHKLDNSSCESSPFLLGFNKLLKYLWVVSTFRKGWNSNPDLCSLGGLVISSHWSSPNLLSQFFLGGGGGGKGREIVLGGDKGSLLVLGTRLREELGLGLLLMEFY